MLDLETFGNNIEGDAALVSIGAVVFDADSDALDLSLLIGDTFERKVDLQRTEIAMRGHIDPSTIEWWLTQDDAARKALTEGERLPLGTALMEMMPWLGEVIARAGTKDVRLWSNGPTFDEHILRRAFTRYGFKFPLSHRGSRCCRTMTAQAIELGFDMAKLGVNGAKHDALADAIFQARGVILQKQFIRAKLRIA